MPENPGKYSYWIGAKKTQDTKEWKWDDGTPFIYKNWDKDYSEGKGKEDCMAMVAVPRIEHKKKGEWFDTYNGGEGTEWGGHPVIESYT